MKKNFINLVKKEIYLNYLISPLGFIFAGLFSTISLWLFFQNFFLIGQADLLPLFDIIPFLFLFFLPAITMNLFAEERKNRTWEVLLTLPTTEVKIVLAKFISAFAFTLLALVLTTPAVILAEVLGQPDWGIIAASYLSTILIAGCYLSAGMFFSSITDNQIVAFITSIFFMLINFFAGQRFILQRLPSIISEIISNLSLNYHFRFFIQGRVPLSSLVFYLSWIGLFLWLTVISLKSRDY